MGLGFRISRVNVVYNLIDATRKCEFVSQADRIDPCQSSLFNGTEYVFTGGNTVTNAYLPSEKGSTFK